MLSRQKIYILTRFAIVSSLLTISGCMTIPEKASGVFFSDEEPNRISQTIFENAEKCWFKKSKIIVNFQRVNNKNTVTAGGVDFFFIAVINNYNQKSKVTVHEGSLPCFMSKPINLNLTEDVSRWVQGDLTCRVEPITSCPIDF